MTKLHTHPENLRPFYNQSNSILLYIAISLVCFFFVTNLFAIQPSTPINSIYLSPHLLNCHIYYDLLQQSYHPTQLAVVLSLPSILNPKYITCRVCLSSFHQTENLLRAEPHYLPVFLVSIFSSSR